MIFRFDVVLEPLLESSRARHFESSLTSLMKSKEILLLSNLTSQAQVGQFINRVFHELDSFITVKQTEFKA